MRRLLPVALSHEDLDAARAQWEEWAGGTGFGLDVVLVGEHGPAEIDMDRPLGAVMRASLSLRLVIRHGRTVVFDEPCPYDGRALRTCVAALARRLGES